MKSKTSSKAKAILTIYGLSDMSDAEAAGLAVFLREIANEVSNRKYREQCNKVYRARKY